LVLIIPPITPIANPSGPADGVTRDGRRVVQAEDYHCALDFLEERGICAAKGR
jgi:hypothetical protein